MLNSIIVKDQKSRKSNLSRIKTKHVEVIPGSSGGIESVLKTLPGVSSANELSSQYSVRGGNFDEKEQSFEQKKNFCAVCETKMGLIRHNPKGHWKIEGQLCRKCWDSKKAEFG